MLNLENQSGQIRYKDFDWRLSVVTACRQHQKIMQPKFTVKLELQELKPEHDSAEHAKVNAQQHVFDMDYTMMKRLEEELKEAVKSVEG